MLVEGAGSWEEAGEQLLHTGVQRGPVREGGGAPLPAPLIAPCNCTAGATDAWGTAASSPSGRPEGQSLAQWGSSSMAASRWVRAGNVLPSRLRVLFLRWTVDCAVQAWVRTGYCVCCVC
jgi:hypothetical protein